MVKLFINDVVLCIVDCVLVLSGGAGYFNSYLFVCACCDVWVGGFMYLFGVNCVFEFVGDVVLG